MREKQTITGSLMRWKRSRTWNAPGPRAIGQLILLLAFLFQWLALDHVREQKADLVRAVSDVNMAQPLSLLQFNHFMDTKEVRHLHDSLESKLNGMYILVSVFDEPSIDKKYGEAWKRIATIQGLDDYVRASKAIEDLDSECRNRMKSFEGWLRLWDRASWAAVFFFSVFGLVLTNWAEYVQKEQVGSSSPKGVEMSAAHLTPGEQEPNVKKPLGQVTKRRRGRR